ncbi:MAG TPA: hypothetical protein VI669_10375 [Vicinamibacteria bacterium]
MALAICVALVALLAVLTTLTGRLHIALLGPRWLRSLGPLEAVVSSLIGTAWWSVLLTSLSLHGWLTPSATGLILVGHGVLLGFVAWRGQMSALRPKGGMSRWGAILVPAIAVSLFGLLPVLRTGSFATANDTLTYSAFAQWLQDHPYGTPIAWRADEPIAFYPALYQGAQAPLAPAFLLAGTQAIARVSSPLVVYPALSTFGFLLSSLGILAAGRWMLRWPTRWLAPLGVVVATLPHPIVTAHHSGFLAQTLGLPALLGVLLILARCLPARRWRGSEAMLLGLLTASLASTYLALLPVAVAAGGCWLLSALRGRAHGHGPRLSVSLLVFAAALVTLLGAQGVNLGRGLRFLGSGVVGFHVGLSPVGFLQLALGAGLWTSERLGPLAETLRAAHLWLAPLYAAIFLVGLFRVAKSTRAAGLGASILFLALGIAYYALRVRDPWTGQWGHTWNVFKLVQWAYPFVLIVQLHGLVKLARHPAVGRVIPWLVLVPIGLLPIQWGLAGKLGKSFEAFVGAPRPLDRWLGLRRSFLELPPGTLLAADRIPDTSQHLPTYLGLLAYPRRVTGDWTGSLWISPDPNREFDALWTRLEKGAVAEGPDRVVPLVTGLHGLVTESVLRLGAGFGALRDGARPQVMAILTPTDSSRGPGGCVWLGRARTRALLFSPRRVSAVLEMKALPGPGALGLGARLIVDTRAAAFEVVVDGSSRIRVPIRLERGINHAQIRFPDLDREIADRRRVCVAEFRILTDDAER